MENMANKIAEYLGNELELDKDRRLVISYGTFAIMQTVVSIFIVFIIGYILKLSTEALIICFTVSILRKYSGGAHASSAERCIILGTILCIGQTIVVKYLLEPLVSIKGLIIIVICSTVIAYFSIYKLVPVDSIKKQIKSQKKIRKMKIYSSITVGIYIFIIFINILFNYTNSIRYSLCILIGLLWQIFTLTASGHFVTNKIDTFLKNILL